MNIMRKINRNPLLTHSAFRHILIAILLIAIFFQSFFTVWQNREKFFARGYEQSYESLREMYYSSQYVKKVNPGIIPDEYFEAFAGGAFLKGMNPILIVHDHPPLGRYIVSVSILLFDNQHIIMLPLLAFSLLGVYLITRLVVSNSLVALAPVAIFANEPLFINKLIYTPLPEPILLPFIIFTFYFFLKGSNNKTYLRWYIASAIMLGCVISIRFFILGAVISFVLFLSLVIKDRDYKRIFTYLATIPLAGCVLLFSYTRTMLDGYSPLQIAGVQRYILDYHKSKFILPFTYWDLLFFNRWHTWWGARSVIPDENWVIFWPVSATITFVSGMLGAIGKIKLSVYELALLLWVVIYSIVLSTGYTSTRYFLPIVPFFYILVTSFLFRLYEFRKKRN